MKQILFIVPKLGTGGTNSSLDSLYPFLKGYFDISVFSISHHPISHNYTFVEALLPMDYWLSIIYSNYSEQRGLNKFVAFFVKILRTILNVFNVDLGFNRCKLVVKKIEQHNKYDYIVGYQEGNATKFASLFKNQNKVAWIHSDYDKYLPQGKTELPIYDAFTKIISVSQYTTSVFNKRYPSLANKTQAIHNIIDIPRILKLSQEPINDSRFDNTSYTIISVGRFAKVKRFSMIPEVAALLKATGMKFIWYVIGPPFDSEEVQLFQDNREKYQVVDCVIWLGGKSNPYPYFATANLYVCLSESEACPMVFKEAHLLGLPIVTTDFPSSYEFITKDNGIISPLQDLPNAIASIKQWYEQGFRIHVNSGDDNKMIINRICSLFN